MRVVQLYEQVRTAHMERVADDAQSLILYRERRYDFDQQVADRTSLKRAGTIGALRYALCHPVDVIEVNEPVVSQAALRTLLFLTGARLRARIAGAPRPRAVAYAIENLPPSRMAQNLPPKAQVKFLLRRPLLPLVWRSMDRVAFGTGASASVYAEFFGSTGPTTRTIAALPEAADVSLEPRDRRLIFLGDLSARKGFPDLVAAWATVRERDPDATLTIIGRGGGADTARRLAEEDERVETLIDPPRSQLKSVLGTAKLIVLPSRRQPLWREQIGLPILEGLSAGCEIVTTTESGIADWLVAHGHQVIPEATVTRDLPDAIVAALHSDRTPAEIVADLPEIDGRTAAREWMFEGGQTMNRQSFIRRVLGRRRQLVSFLRGVRHGHPGVRFGPGVRLTGPGKYQLARGVFIGAGVRAWVGADAVLTMEPHTKIGDRSIVNAETGVTIRRGSEISWDVQVLDTDFHWIQNDAGRVAPHTEAVTIGPSALVGTRAIVLKGVTIGEGSVVGAGAVVHADVPDRAVVAGNPAKTVGVAAGWGAPATRPSPAQDSAGDDRGELPS